MRKWINSSSISQSIYSSVKNFRFLSLDIGSHVISLCTGTVAFPSRLTYSSTASLRRDRGILYRPMAIDPGIQTHQRFEAYCRNNIRSHNGRSPCPIGLMLTPSQDSLISDEQSEEGRVSVVLLHKPTRVANACRLMLQHIFSCWEKAYY